MSKKVTIIILVAAVLALVGLMTAVYSARHAASSANVVTVKDSADFQAQVKNSTLPVFIVFTASDPACTPCQKQDPLIEQAVVNIPRERGAMNQQSSFAVGLIETQGFTAVFEAIDTAVKTAAVEVLAREKLGGGYITVLIKGDVAAVQAAVDAGKAKVEGLGRLIAAVYELGIAAPTVPTAARDPAGSRPCRGLSSSTWGATI